MYVDHTANRVVTSPSDLSTWAACEWAFLRRLDAKLGRIDPIVDPADAMLERTAALGIAHEERYLAALKERVGAENVTEFLDRPKPSEYAQAADEAKKAMQKRTKVLYQATFFDGEFLGFSDFLELNDAGAYEVYDTKLARKAKISTLLQLAGYAEQIDKLGIPVGEQVHLVLGDGRVSSHALADILPVYRTQLHRLRSVLAERLDDTDAVQWGDPRFTACGRCSQCEVEVQASRDVVLVAGMRLEQRANLNAAGIVSIDDLAASTGPVNGISPKVLERLRRQAAAQIATENAATTGGGATGGAVPAVELLAPRALDAIPAPDAGDIFFDFEGDPLYTEDNTNWGLDYLFGLVESDETFRAFWAHTIADERTALTDFLAYVKKRRKEHPGMHIYHYAAYEKTHLLSIAARHGVGEDEVDELLRQNVLVDLYPIVRQALVVGSHSYSIKKLEPLYMDTTRAGYDVANAVDSIAAYADAIAEKRDGDAAKGQQMLDQVAAYNEYDCVSTLKLRDWLLDLRDEAQGAGTRGDTDNPTATVQPELVEAPVPPEPNPTYVALMSALDGVDPADRTADQTAVALAASAIDYHRREAKKSWQEHFNRLEADIDDFADERDVFVVERGSVDSDWAPPEGRARSWSRILRLTLRPAPGSRLTAGSKPRALYDFPPPPGLQTSGPASRGYTGSIEVTDIVATTETTVEALVLERLPAPRKGADPIDPYDDLPVALTPGPPIATKVLSDAIGEWGAGLLDAGIAAAVRPSAGAEAYSASGGGSDGADPTSNSGRNSADPARGGGDGAQELPADPVLDLLRRRPPRAQLAPIVDDDTVEAVVSTLLTADRTYLAIQGPPGTGKTYVGSNVIARLVAQHGWRIGVVAQSHAAVENVLDSVVKNGRAVGLDPAVVGKAPRDPDAFDGDWTPLVKKTGETDFLARDGGLVFGGTAWTFAGSVVERRSLDLLVVEEAGQFSLAPTIAAAVSADRLLLLGDPQQLPQVSQGTHPEPVDESALGWLSEGHDVLPAEFGYFLAETRRMGQELTTPVSDLSYAGELRSRAPRRRLDGIDPGLHTVPVDHQGNTTSSPEEAERVVALALDAVGRRWFDGAGPGGDPLADGATGRTLEASDIIVVAPYNAQVHVIRDALDAAGLHDTQAGTVDMFQGREGVLAIVSLAASSGADIARGLEFLLQPNRLNVAISRAQWAAYLVMSPRLATGLPHSVGELSLLSRFIRLTESGEG